MNDRTGAEIVGLIAGFGTTFAVVPDLVRILKRRSTRGTNPSMPAIMAVFQAVWMCYGVMIGSRPIVMWNVVAVVINSLSVAAYFHYARREKRSPAIEP
jgi:MtN3 and saliva related transmembrane protein